MSDLGASVQFASFRVRLYIQYALRRLGYTESCKHLDVDIYTDLNWRTMFFENWLRFLQGDAVKPKYMAKNGIYSLISNNSVVLGYKLKKMTHRFVSSMM